MKNAFVLGGTNSHSDLIKNLKTRGYKTFLIDYLHNPPAKEYADIHIQESSLDKDLVLDICAKGAADLVISTSIDQAMVTAAYVAEKLGLPAYLSYQTALDVTNKTLMKKKMLDYGIPSSKYQVLSNLDELVQMEFRYPLVVKPADSNSSKGVRKVDNPDELRRFAADAFDISRDKKIIVEQFAEGLEIGMDCFVENGQVKIVMMHRKRKPMLDNEYVMFSIGSVSPPGLNPTNLEKIQTIANQIAAAFNLDNCPLLIQMIVNGDDVNVIEFAPRIGGGLNFRTLLKYYKFDVINAAIDSYLRNKVTVASHASGFFHAENHLYAKPGIMGQIEGIQALIDEGTIDEIYINKAKGTHVSEDLASNNRIASFFCNAPTLTELEAKVRTAIDGLSVLDEGGQDFLNRRLYQDLKIL